MTRVHRSVLAVVCFVVVLAQPAGAVPAADTASRAESPWAIHSMVYSSSPYGFKRAMFAEAAATGATSVRLDLVLGSIFAAGADAPAWREVDEIVALAREFRVSVTGIVLDTPWWLAACKPGIPAERTGSCPPRDPREYAALVGQVAAHTRGAIDTFEILNEPDGDWAYSGTPRDYAHTLSESYAAVKRANPSARVLIGGVMGVQSIPWLEQVFATPNANAARKFDIANVHMRGKLATIDGHLRTWRRFFARHEIDAPLWVTEHGYPSDPAYQYDPGHRGGEAAQASYLVASTRILLEGGVDRVFITLRDNLGGEFASEGLIGGSVLDPPVDNPQVRRKPAFRAFRRMAGGPGDSPRPRRRLAMRYRGR